jgi:tetratricopeptide (TPR) repeat protein
MKKSYAVLVVTVTIVLTVFCAFSPVAAETCIRWIGKAVSVQGSVEVRRTGEAQWQSIRLNDVFCPGDTLRVQAKSRAAIILMNETTLRLDQNTSITFSKIEEEKTSVIDLITGMVHFFSRIRRSLKVSTPFVNGTVEGTEFLVSAQKDKTVLSVFEGQVIASNEKGSITLRSGQSAVAERDRAPLLSIGVRPRNAVQWTLYYPVITSAPQPGWQTEVATLLSVGRVDEADKVIEKILGESPNDSDALAFQSVIALALNRQEEALDTSKKAVVAAPRSSSARIALSYALQSLFDLKGALASLQEAVRLDPGNSLAWARLAELWMSRGYLDEALEASHRAVALDPKIARAQTVLGFAYLTQIRTGASREAFEKAIALDQADPLPRLGLGLAKIRDGGLEAGREEIEIAASLDPNNSLVRSYLGKSFYEEKRDSKASYQYSVARELDPLDPTPFFYDAILKQSLNRPVEALHDLQKAISLNDNRGVYRSRLMLDSDLAARSASLATIYTDLGFQQAALVAGWNSVNTDPSNFSGHRFLSDSYYALPRHEIARVSELLQSQLLQPIDINPVQPSLGEAKLFILNNAGPSDPSFNEFNPLFNRNRLALQLNGIAGGNDTFGEEMLQSGVYGRFSYSVGQFHYKTNGFRENNDQERNIYDAFAQWSLSPETSLQAEFRYKNAEKGDLTLNFDPSDFLPNLRQKENSRFVRVGLHHVFSPGSGIIGSVSYQNLNGNLDDIPFPSTAFGINTHEDSYGAELQHLFRYGWLRITSGAGYFKVSREDTISTEIADPPMQISEISESDIHHTNLYLYSLISALKCLTITIGGSGDFLEGAIVDSNQFNPKLGLTWTPLHHTTLRTAVFRTLTRTLITSQTLEPTQVAGFNQFFDDLEGTEAWSYGIAADQQFSQNIYGGLEYLRRTLDVPFSFVPLPPEAPIPEIRRVDWKEGVGHAYFYWAPHPWVTMSAEYRYEKFDREREYTQGIANVKTHRFPLGINFFHPSGLGAHVKATFTHQTGTFQPQGSPPDTFLPGSDNFWVVDASLSYRLPKRFGLVTLAAANLLNNSFRYQDTDPANPSIQPKRTVFLKVTIAL